MFVDLALSRASGLLPAHAKITQWTTTSPWSSRSSKDWKSISRILDRNVRLPAYRSVGEIAVSSNTVRQIGCQISPGECQRAICPCSLNQLLSIKEN
jgi:hypothetical protein